MRGWRYEWLGSLPASVYRVALEMLDDGTLLRLNGLVTKDD